MEAHDIGDRIEVTAVFTDIEGDAMNPSDVKFILRSPAGELTEYEDDAEEMAHPETGTFVMSIDPDESGLWRYRWEGTGAVVAAEEGMFYVRLRRVADAS